MNAVTSLCRFPNCSGADCAICAHMRNPAPLTSHTLGKLARGLHLAPKAPQVTRTVDAAELSRAELAEMERAGKARRAALQAEIDATKAEIARLQTRRTVGLHPAPVSPVPTAPMAPPVVKAAPAPQVVRYIDGPLKMNDWAGLAARVEAGLLTHTDAERIGSEWMTAFHTPVKGGALA